jgi:hypothetical protein
MSTADYSAQLQREADWQRQLMQDRQMRDNPWLVASRWRLGELQPDGQLSAHDQRHHADHASGHARRQYAGAGPGAAGVQSGNHRREYRLRRATQGATRRAATICRSQFGASDQSLRAALAIADEQPGRDSQYERLSFPVQRGQQALERSAAAKGMLRSGNTLAALTNYGQGAASRNTATRLADSGR